MDADALGFFTCFLVARRWKLVDVNEILKHTAPPEFGTWSDANDQGVLTTGIQMEVFEQR